ncbi:MAG: GNAT family N-acetyltransferase [Candidatus Thorarchaeota archaeon]
MTVKMRDYHWDDDFDNVRKFLGNMFFIQRSYTNWLPTSLENVKFGPGGTEYLEEEDEHLKIWECYGLIVALSVTKPAGDCHLSIHPDVVTSARKIVLWMQEQIRSFKEHESLKMRLVVDDADEELRSILTDLGFKEDEIEGDNQIWQVGSPIPDYSLPDGYTIRNAVIKEDYEKYRRVQKAVFPHIKSMSNKLLDTYSEASFYKEELDIVAVAPDGEFAAFCTARIDPVSRITELEPVGTHPDHRKLGLGKAVILEAFKRLQKFRPTAVVILGAAPTEGARGLYRSVGFERESTAHYWAKMV